MTMYTIWLWHINNIYNIRLSVAFEAITKMTQNKSRDNISYIIRLCVTIIQLLSLCYKNTRSGAGFGSSNPSRTFYRSVKL